MPAESSFRSSDKIGRLHAESSVYITYWYSIFNMQIPLNARRTAECNICNQLRSRDTALVICNRSHFTCLTNDSTSIYLLLLFQSFSNLFYSSILLEEYNQLLLYLSTFSPSVNYISKLHDRLRTATTTAAVSEVFTTNGYILLLTTAARNLAQTQKQRQLFETNYYGFSSCPK